MDKPQAEDFVRASLNADAGAREEMQRKRLAEEQSLAEWRRVAWFALVGAAIGAVCAYLSGHRVASGIVWGGIAASAIGRLFVVWRRRRAAS